MNFFSIQINVDTVWMIKQLFDNSFVSINASIHKLSPSKTIWRIAFNSSKIQIFWITLKHFLFHMFPSNDGFTVVHTFSENDMFVALLAAAFAKPALPDTAAVANLLLA